MGIRLAKPILFIVGGVALFATVFVAALPYFVSTELVRNAVQNELSDFTGQKVVLRGDIQLSLFPSPEAQLANVVIPGPDDDGIPILEIESVKVEIALLTLLSRTPQFNGFDLQRPRLNLTRAESGEINWQDGFSRISSAVNIAKNEISKQQETGDLSRPETDAMLPANFPTRLGNVTINGGSISVRDTASEVIFEATALDGTIAWAALNEPISIQTAGILRGLPVALTTNIAEPLSMMAGQVSQADLALTSDIGAASFSGMLGYFDNLFADGDLSIDIKSAPAVLDYIDADIRAGNAFAEVLAIGPVLINGGNATFENLDITIDGNIGKGVLEIASPDDAAPLLAGTLDFQTLDMTAFLGAFFELPNETSDLEDSIDLSVLSQLRTDLRVSATEANFGNVEMANIAATAQIGPTAAIFDLGDAEAYNGSIQARLQILTSDQNQMSAQTSFSAQSIDMASMATSLELPDILPSGTATLAVDIETSISNWASMLESASGEATLQMGTGVIQGFGVKRLLAEENGNQFFTLTNAEAPEEAFDKLALNGALSNGIVSIQNAQIDYPEGNVSFEGVAPIGSGGIALTATAASAIADTEQAPKRFFIGGSWDRAFATPLLPSIAPLQ